MKLPSLPVDGARAGDPIAAHETRADVTLVDLRDLSGDPTVLYQPVSWWRNLWRRLVR